MTIQPNYSVIPLLAQLKMQQPSWGKVAAESGKALIGGASNALSTHLESQQKQKQEQSQWFGDLMKQGKFVDPNPNKPTGALTVGQMFKTRFPGQQMPPQVPGELATKVFVPHQDTSGILHALPSMVSAMSRGGGGTIKAGTFPGLDQDLQVPAAQHQPAKGRDPNAIWSKADTAARAEINNRVHQAAQGTDRNNPYNDPMTVRDETIKLTRDKAIAFGADPSEAERRYQSKRKEHEQTDADYKKHVMEAIKRVKKDPKLKGQMQLYLKKKFPDYTMQIDRDLRSGATSDGMPEASEAPPASGGGIIGRLLGRG